MGASGCGGRGLSPSVATRPYYPPEGPLPPGVGGAASLVALPGGKDGGQHDGDRGRPQHAEEDDLLKAEVEEGEHQTLRRSEERESACRERRRLYPAARPATTATGEGASGGASPRPEVPTRVSLEDGQPPEDGQEDGQGLAIFSIGRSCSGFN